MSGGMDSGFAKDKDTRAITIDLSHRVRAMEVQMVGVNGTNGLRGDLRDLKDSQNEMANSFDEKIDRLAAKVSEMDRKLAGYAAAVSVLIFCLELGFRVFPVLK